MNISILKVVGETIDEEKQLYRIDIVFKCNDCLHIYKVGEDNIQRWYDFYHSLLKGKPCRDIRCTNCDEYRKMDMN